ncbi:hypothetical protein K2X92_06080 [Candidatus Gracilibacteria bacterium]|nr:hypothetical protein [Candidatus Gracilibacteria bacterium]
MNNTIQRKERVESIGGITPEIALKQVFAIEHEDEIAMFYGKTLLDVGAGFSDLLHHISEYSEPARMIAVDPIYGGQEASATAFTLQSIEGFIADILSDPILRRDQTLIHMREVMERQKQVIMDYAYQANAIERYGEIPPSVGANYAFLINVFYAVENPRILLERVDRALSRDGEIIIIDYTNRHNHLDRKFAMAGIPMKRFEQYYMVKLKKGEVLNLYWSQ